MAIADRSSFRRTGGVLLAALTLCLAGSVQPAAAQGLFEALFGGFQPAVRPSPATAGQFVRRSVRACSAISGRPAKPAASATARSICVRTCDGRYFPLQRHAGATPAELCKSFCPAAKTMVFSGSKIDTAVAPNGTRYADLDNAFAYRDKVSDSCTCNGKDGLGLARVDASERSDAAAGRHRCDQRRSGHLHAARAGPRSSRRSTRRRANGRGGCAEVKVRPAPPSEKIEPVANDDTRPVRRSRAQAAPRSRALSSSIECATTSSASDSDEVSPGDSIPNRWTRPRQPMLRRTFDHEIGGRLARSGQLRPDAGVVGLQ